MQEWILNAIGGYYSRTGDKFRIAHPETIHGDPCSNGKDPACVVTRVSNGYVWKCHRCGEKGFIGDGGLSPKATIEKITALQKKAPAYDPKVAPSLPHDFIPMPDEPGHGPPWAAHHWLWRYELRQSDIDKWGIGWSEAYKRVIIPVYEYAWIGGQEAKKLVGWVGREVEYNSKAERKKAKVAKYITKTFQKGKRIYFMCPGDRMTWVLVEDAISAIKVHKSIGATTLALLNKEVGSDLMPSLRGRKVILWLDKDAVSDSVRSVQRMRQLGLDAHHVGSNKDPKSYNTIYINDVYRAIEKGA